MTWHGFMGPSLALWAPALERLFNSPLLTGSFSLQQELVRSVSCLFLEDASLHAGPFAPGLIRTSAGGSSLLPEGRKKVCGRRLASLSRAVHPQLYGPITMMLEHSCT